MRTAHVMFVRQRLIAAVVVSGVLASLPTVAHAQAGSPEPAPPKEPATAETSEAQRLYNEGRTSFDAGDYTKACALFEQSYSLSGSAGALLSRADCEEKRGNLGTAYELWKQGAALLVREPDRAAFATTRANALEARLVEVELVLPSTSGVVLEVDGMSLGPARSPLRVQAGKHVVKATAPSGETDEATIEAVLGTPLRVELLEDRGASPEKLRPPPEESGISALGIAGWTLVGVGAASLVGFAVTSGVFVSECGSITVCEVPKSDVEGLGIANVVLLVAGGVLGVTGGALLVVDVTMQADVSTDGAFFGVGARF